MLSKKQRRMLELLDGQIQSCTECLLHVNGRAKPYWTEKSKYVLILEAPGGDEVRENTPTIGKAGRILWDAFMKYDLKREDFLIINSVNCRPMVGNRNGKPTYEEMDKCRHFVYKYINVLNPKFGMVFGNYAMWFLFGIRSGITRHNGNWESNISLKVDFVKSVHPASVIYTADNRKILERSIDVFSRGIKKHYSFIPDEIWEIEI